MERKCSPTHSTHIVEEKVSAEHAEAVFNATMNTGGLDERRLVRRIDWRLLPWLIFLYLLSFLDRSSIGNARLYNLEHDLKMSDNQYLVSLTVFFFSYAIFEVPSNIFLKRLRPSVWFSVLMFMWGLMMIRLAVLNCATTLAGAFGGLLAAAISNMDGVGGKPAWAWIFIIEGLATIMAGVASIWVVQDFPDSAKFLSEDERTLVVQRLQGDDQQFSASGEKLPKQAIVASFRDWKTWLGRFGATAANLLVVPVYAFASIVTCCVALYADKHGRRGYCNIAMLSIGQSAWSNRWSLITIEFSGAIGYIILIVSRNAALSYFAVFVATCGIFPVVPNTIAWIANNCEGSYKRAVSLAMAISMGNLNGAVSSNVYRARDQPWYPLGHGKFWRFIFIIISDQSRTGLVLMYICIGILANATFLYLLKKENVRRDRGERDEIIGQMSGEDNGNGKFATVEDAKRQKGDRWSGYRYIL
ncbi:major facilitator superfamily domain-containing protein [Mycena galopus ATCC 62051]|nr:major facilitator superfamily domain-containing protein [Mycena galopus ATCC 62051]